MTTMEKELGIIDAVKTSQPQFVKDVEAAKYKGGVMLISADNTTSELSEIYSLAACIKYCGICRVVVHVCGTVRDIEKEIEDGITEAELPEFKEAISAANNKAANLIMMQCAFAADYSPNEMKLLGYACKYATSKGVTLIIIPE